MLAVKDAPFWKLLEHISAEVAQFVAQYYFGSALAAVIATIAVSASFDAFFSSSEPTTPEEPLPKAIGWALSLAAVVVVAPLGGALLWAAATRAAASLEAVGPIGGIAASMVVAVAFYIMIRKELRRR